MPLKMDLSENTTIDVLLKLVRTARDQNATAARPSPALAWYRWNNAVFETGGEARSYSVP